jgi:hypothetical protein
MTITLPDGTTTIDITPSETSNRYCELCGDDYIELVFSSPTYIEIGVGSSTEFEGNTYYVFMPQDVKINNTRNYEYTVKMYTNKYVWHNRPFVNPDDMRVKFPVTGRLIDHITLIVRSANMQTQPDFTWSYGNIASDSVEKSIAYDSLTLWDAIKLAAEEFGVEFNIYTVYVGSGIYANVVDVCVIEYDRTSPLALSYGKNNGIVSGITRSGSAEMTPVRAVYVKGGSRNIDKSTYYPGEGAGASSLELHMPATVYQDTPAASFGNNYNGPIRILYDFINDVFYYSTSCTNVGGIISYGYYVPPGSPGLTPFVPENYRVFEISLNGKKMYEVQLNDPFTLDYTEYVPRPWEKVDVLDLSDIYPNVTHTITSVIVNNITPVGSDPTATYILIATPSIDYRDYLIPGAGNMSIVFQTGNLAGKEFDVNFSAVTIQGATEYRFRIISKIIDDVEMPGGSFVPAQGDTFRVFGCMPPREYIRQDYSSVDGYVFRGAEWEMAKEAIKTLLNENDFNWDFDLDGIWVSQLSNANFAKLKVGGYVLFSDAGVHPSGQKLKITAIKQPLNHPKWLSLTLSNSKKRNGNSVNRLVTGSSNSMTGIISAAGNNYARERINNVETEATRGISSLSGRMTTAENGITSLGNSVAALPTYADAYNELEDNGTGISVNSAKCQSANYVKFTSERRSATRDVIIGSDYDGIETSLMMRNESGTEITLTIKTPNDEELVFDSSNKNDTIMDNTVRMLTYWRMGSTYYVIIKDVI